ncbi:hypothetical protein ACIA8G_21645 [Lentzea sp. NPDC051213]|uniref:hypothetical protein n=1 Tax=Lentzea sp. NPDC051213 TaxID=3364126 RepID=UPI0037B4271E
MTAVTDREPELVEDSAVQLSRHYRGLFAWPTTIDTATGDVRLQLGDVVDALFIRAGFASEVNHFLVMHVLRAPIIVVPGRPDDWIFLTKPRTAMRTPVWKDLVDIQVGWRKRGAAIPLSALDREGDELRWFERPQHYLDLPLWTAVVGAARAASNPSGRW